MRLTATELRSNLYQVLDRVAETGEPVEIVRRGRVIRIVAEALPPQTFSMTQLREGPRAIVGDPGDLVGVDWSAEWNATLPDDE